MKTKISRLLVLTSLAIATLAASAPSMAHCGYVHAYYGYARPHVYYRAPRVVYSPVIVYRPAPVYYAPTPVYYTQPYPAWGATGGAVAGERLRVMEKESDGFKIAEADLKLRGPGEFLGTRQSGLVDFRLANLTRDARLLIEARKEALAWLDKDPQLKSKESAGMRELLRHRWGKRLQLGTVG